MDDVDRADKQQQAELDRVISAARGEIPKGQPGECRDCGDEFNRLVNGLCVQCRSLRGE